MLHFKKLIEIQAPPFDDHELFINTGSEVAFAKILVIHKSL